MLWPVFLQEMIKILASACVTILPGQNEGGESAWGHCGFVETSLG